MLSSLDSDCCCEGNVHVLNGIDCPYEGNEQVISYDFSNRGVVILISLMELLRVCTGIWC